MARVVESVDTRDLKKLSPRGETPEVNPVKVGEGPDHVPQLVELTPNQARRIKRLSEGKA
jgi:hypothetical protein